MPKKPPTPPGPKGKAHRADDPIPQTAWNTDVDTTAILDTISDHIAVIGCDYTILWANSAVCRQFGNDVIGKKCYEAFQGRKQACEPSPCQTMQVFEDGKNSAGEKKAVGKDGQDIHFHITASALLKDETDTPYAVMEISRDITNQKRAEKSLKESEERFRHLYEMAPLPYQSLDFDGLLLDVNQAWLVLLGYERDEVIGRSFGDFLPTEWQEHFKDNFPRFKDKGEILGVEFEVLKKDGFSILISAVGKIGYDEQGEFRQTHCILHDITARRQVERDKEQLIIELQESMKKVKTLSGFLPICASCKKIRDDQGYWNQIEHYIKMHSEAEFSHSICPDCSRRLYPEIYDSDE